MLDIAGEDLKRNQQAFAEAAGKVDPTKPPKDVLADVEKDYPPATELLSVTQSNLDSLAQFVRDKQIIDLPQAPPVRVVETPPFLRATTSASMDTPGPFETVATEAYFNMTLPDPSWPQAKQDDFMSQWYRPMISKVSVHEVWPGHYVQFLYAKDYPSDVRKVFAKLNGLQSQPTSGANLLDRGTCRHGPITAFRLTPQGGRARRHPRRRRKRARPAA